MRVGHYIDPLAPSDFLVGVPNEVYHAAPGISKSGLDLVHKSPAHYAHRKPFDPTPAMRIGTAVHCAVLEPDRFATEYVVVDSKDRRQKAYKDAVEEHGVELVLLPNEAEDIRAIQDAAHGRSGVRPLVSAEGWRELSAFAKDPETGVQVRCRYDLLAADGFAVDLKTARDVFPRGFERSIASYRYHVQVAFYSDVYEWITGEKLTEFWLLVVEATAPYTVIPYRLDDAAIEQGRIDYRKNLNTYAECLSSDSWPHFEPESDLLTLPAWAFDEIEELEGV